MLTSKLKFCLKMLVMIGSLLAVCCTKVDVTLLKTNDTKAPIPGNSGLLDLTSYATAVDVRWTPGSDNHTRPKRLRYQVFYSTLESLGTLADIQSNGVPFGEQTLNITSIMVTGLVPLTTYYFNVVMTDESGLQTVYKTNSIATSADAVAPTVVITSTVSSPTSDLRIPLTFTFNESVTGFTASDIVLTNGTLADFVGSGTTYTANLYPTAQGTVSVSVPQSSAQDASGNNNVVSNTLSWTFIFVGPTVVISSAASSPTSITSIPVTFTFSEIVTGFTSTDVVLTNSSITDFSGSGTTYTANIIPTTEGPLSVSVPAAIAQNATSNFNSASNTIAFTFLPVLTSRWTSLSPTGAPTRRYLHTAIWTGSKMIIWGGGWEPAGTETGGIFDPVLNSWTATETLDAPVGRTSHSAIWTGSKMIVWGGYTPYGLSNTGGIYDPGLNSWVPTETANAPTGRTLHTAIWTGSKMIVWGGDISNVPSNTGGIYDPVLNTWVSTESTNAPNARYLHTAVWTGDRMIVWGGSSISAPLNTGGIFNPTLNSWITTQTTNSPTGRNSHTAVWTGSKMIVWGGDISNVRSDTGGIYDPVLDTWVSTETTNAPTARSLHTAVWTGNKMIVWGGSGASGPLITGGIYDPVYDFWTETEAAIAPAPRYSQSAVWTGSKMIIWGGFNSFFSRGVLDIGAIFTISSLDTDQDGVVDINDCSDNNPAISNSCPDNDSDGFAGDNDENDADASCYALCTDNDGEGFKSNLDCDDSDPTSASDCTDSDNDGFYAHQDCDDFNNTGWTNCSDNDSDGRLADTDPDDFDPGQ